MQDRERRPLTITQVTVKIQKYLLPWFTDGLQHESAAAGHGQKLCGKYRQVNGLQFLHNHAIT